MKNALGNREKLISFFDLYQTLRDFLKISTLGYLDKNASPTVSNYKNEINSILRRSSRGISLFENIPNNRSCTHAYIPNKVCSCFEQFTISESQFAAETNSSFAIGSAHIIENINKLTGPHRALCVKYNLEKIVSVKKVSTSNAFKFYTFTVVLTPGNAWYEANLFVNKENKNINSMRNFFKMKDYPIRMSPYGNQSRCIQGSFLKNYCFCN
jgi:hypothetical protein